MKATYLITVDLAEGDTLNAVAREIFDMLESNFVVHEVKAWNRRVTAPEPVIPVQGSAPASVGLPLSNPQNTN